MAVSSATGVRERLPAGGLFVSHSILPRAETQDSEIDCTTVAFTLTVTCPMSVKIRYKKEG